MEKYRKLIQWVLLSLMILVPHSVLSSQQIHSSFHDKWIKPSDSLTITVPQTDPVTKYAFFFNTSDVTQLFAAIRPGEYRYQNSLLPLVQGEQEVIVYGIDLDNNWTQAASFNLKVLSDTGFQQSEINPSATITIDSQWNENHKGDAQVPERHRFHDLSAQASLQTKHARPGLEFSSNTNIVAASNRKKALRYDVEGSDAPKIDLADYIVEMSSDDLEFSVGHISSGNNRLLFSEIDHRGIKGNYRFNQYFNLALSSQNGTAITGYNNLFGVSHAQHRINAGTLGWEIFPENAGQLKAELTYLNSSIESISNFDVGEVTDAEESDGWGLRLSGNLLEGRLRYDGVYARSRFNNPDDPLLAQGDELVEVKESTDNARFVELSYDLFGYDSRVGSLPLLATLTFTHERNDPLYRTLAAATQADIDKNTLALQGSVDSISYTVSYSRSEDNLNNIDSILKTATRDWKGLINIPLNEYLSDPQAVNHYWPSVSIVAQRVHQYALNSPAADGEFNTTNHLPDQMNDNVTTILNWGLESWDLGYEFGYSNQDNRQTGRDKADFKTLSHNVNVNIQSLNKVSFGFSLGRADTRDEEQQVNNISDTGGFYIDWQIWEDLAFSGKYDKSYDHDSEDASKSISESYELMLRYQFKVKMDYRKQVPGQFFVRFAKQDSSLRDNVFGFKSDAESWTITSGLSMNF